MAASRSTDGRPAAVVHLDLDGARHIYAVHGWRFRGATDPVFESGLPHALHLFDRIGVKATLFVIAEDLDDDGRRALLAEAVARGHEIASHSLTHRRLRDLDREGKRREIRESRSRIADRLGVEAHGFRAPVLSIDRESLELIDDAGYTYDSSLEPGRGRARRHGPRPSDAGPAPALPGRSLLELTLPPHAPLPTPFHPSYSLVLGEAYFRFGLRRARSSPEPLVLLFHLIDFADPLPADLLDGPRQRLFTLSHRSGEEKRRRCEAMLLRLAESFDIVPTRTILDRAVPEAAAIEAEKPS